MRQTLSIKLWLAGQTCTRIIRDHRMQNKSMLAPAEPFSQQERNAVYKATHTRRDVRDQFLPDPIPNDVVHILLKTMYTISKRRLLHSKISCQYITKVASVFGEILCPMRVELEMFKQIWIINILAAC